VSGIVLASKSPQRRALLDALGLDFEVQAPEVDEETEGPPRDLVVRNATRKAEAIAAQRDDAALVIAGDTEVVIDGEVLGQPRDETQARSHLERLSGAEHHVLGGLALLGPGAEAPRTGVDVSTVAFREIDDGLLDAYLASGEWRGRAGSYAIQG